MWPKSHFAGVVIAGAVTFSSYAAHAAVSCGWKERGSLDEGGITQAVTVGDKIYLLGSGGFEAPSNLVRAYDPVTSTWEDRASMPGASMVFGAAELAGKIYRVGGIVDGTFAASADVYDPATDAWAPIADLPVESAYVTAASLDGKIYAIGGLSSSDEVLADVHAYDPATNQWSVVAPMKTARMGHASVTVNGKIYAIGGRGEGAAAYTSVESYDPTANEWSVVYALPRGRVGLTSVAFGGQIYVVGGMAGDLSGSVTVLSSVLRFDPTTKAREELASMRTASLVSGAAVFGNELFTFGGLSEPSGGVLDGVAALPLATKNGLLSRSSEEPEGENCPAGGTRVEVGFDTSCDGELDDEDEPSVIYVCRGNEGTEAGDVLIESHDEPAGENCSHGGTRVDAGRDTDGDGKLSSDEVTTTTFVCEGGYGNRGADGADGLDGRDGMSGTPGSSGCSAAPGRAGSGAFLFASGIAALLWSRSRRR